MIVVDTNFLVLLLDPKGAMPHLDRGKERALFFIRELGQSREEIMIPAPVISELVAAHIDRMEEIVALLQRQRAIIVQPFDQIVAIEAGEMIRRALPDAERIANWRTTLKFDAMVAATAVVWRARAVCTNNEKDFRRYLKGTGIEIINPNELPLPPEDPQSRMTLEGQAPR